MRHVYVTPRLVAYGDLTSLTGADLTTASNDIYYDQNGNDVPSSGLTGSGPGCADGNSDGTCDYLQ